MRRHDRAMQEALDKSAQAALAGRPAATTALSRPIAAIVAFAVVLWLAASVLPTMAPSWADLSAVFLDRQDRWLLLCQLVLLGLACIGLPAASRRLSLPAWAPWPSAVVLALVCFAGHAFVLCGHDLSRDEQMAVFDSRIFASGRLAAPLPAIWQAHADALNLLFMLPVAHPVAWVSGYLPMNAALRALVGLVADPAWTGPLLTGAGLVLLWQCARRLWPLDREAAAVAALLYVGSGQVLLAGMTAYAMPAHLALDLLWLRLFLVGRPGADVAALAVGWVATGLHQPLFHPLFAVPFLVGLVRDRAWLRVALYGAGYAAICTFWMAWPIAIHALVAAPGAPPPPAGTDYVSRLVATVATGDATRWPDMAANLLRFAAWQPVLMVPLMAAGLAFAWRERPTLALAASVALPILVMGIILPYQGHGFGYRYLHGVLGPAILLAAQGYRHLARRERRLRPLLVRTWLAGMLVVLPLQAHFAHVLYAAAARVDARIRQSTADYAIVGAADAPFARDLVLDRPDLSNRPLRLLGDKLDDALIAAICHKGVRVAVPTAALFAPIDAALASAPTGAADASSARLSPKLEAAGCSVERVVP